MSELLIARRRVLAGLAAGPLALIITRAWAQNDPRIEQLPDDPLMAAVAARYAALSSYSDTGTVETVYRWPGTPALCETHSFSTAFRRPRAFYFHFIADPAAGGDEFVVWCDGIGPFQSWWKATGVHEVYDGGRGALAFALGSSPTKESVNLLAPFLFPAAELSGPISKLFGVTEQPATQLDGRRVRLLAAMGHQTGLGEETREIEVWLDTETGLIRQTFLGTMANQTQDLVDETTYRLEPGARQSG
jgi:hypothetical protein